MPHCTTNPCSTRTKTRVVIKMMTHKVVETVRSKRRPRSRHAEYEIAFVVVNFT